jgi:hypothetical protein
METHELRSPSSCPFTISRRQFLATAGVSALALKIGVLDFASSVFAEDAKSAKGPTVRAAFMHPRVEKYWMGWPGASYDIAGHQKLYTETLTKAAEKLGVTLQVVQEPIAAPADLDAFLEKLKSSPVDGVLLACMDLNHGWDEIDTFVAKRGTIPTVIFSPMGTSFTGHLQKSARAPGVFLGATQDVDWLTTGLKLFKASWQMKTTRILVIAGDKAEDRTLDIVGTTLHHIPRSRFPEELKKVEASDEVKAIADYFTKEAKGVREPSKNDILNAAKNYVAARRLMAAENCQAITMDCLGLVGSRQIPCPPCMAWLKLLDEGQVGCCEADIGAAISLALSSYLCDRPGFMQDPAPNTVNNTLMGAHCTCPTKLDGFDKPHEPFLLRSHSESAIGVSPQVLWRLGQKVTLMKFEGPGTMLLGTGKVVANIDTPPSGGCRTSVEVACDDIPDCRDVKGFHQLFMYGDMSHLFKAYGQLFGTKVVHI